MLYNIQDCYITHPNLPDGETPETESVTVTRSPILKV